MEAVREEEISLTISSVPGEGLLMTITASLWYHGAGTSGQQGVCERVLSFAKCVFIMQVRCRMHLDKETGRSRERD